jgi:hypothetical protein
VTSRSHRNSTPLVRYCEEFFLDGAPITNSPHHIGGVAIKQVVSLAEVSALLLMMGPC